MPLVGSRAVLAIALLTFGAGVLLAPIALVPTLVAARRLEDPRGPAFWLGAGVSLWLTLLFVLSMATLAYDLATGRA